MDPNEIIEQIEQAYATAFGKLAALDEAKQQIIAQYIKDLETKKIEDIRNELQKLAAGQN